MLGTIGSAVIGFLIGRAFDGTVMPYLIGTALCALGGFVALIATEPRRLFERLEAQGTEPILPTIPEEVV